MSERGNFRPTSLLSPDLVASLRAMTYSIHPDSPQTTPPHLDHAPDPPTDHRDRDRDSHRGSFGRAVLLSLAGVAFWSTNALAGNAALSSSPLIQVIAVQFAAATVVLYVLRIVTAPRSSPPEKRTDAVLHEKAFGYMVGVVGLGGTMVLQYVAFANAPILDANIIAYSWPMIAAVFLAVTAVTAFTTSTAVSLLLSLAGFGGVTLIVVGQGSDAGSAGNPLLGYGAALGSAACMAFYTIGMRSVKIPVFDLMLVTTGIGAITAAAIMVATGTAVAVSPEAALAIYIGVGPVALGYALWSFGMQRSSGRLAPLGFMTPVLSTLVLLIGGQTFGTTTAVGAVIVLACTIGILTVDRYIGNKTL